jgi:hypothetical protein
MSLRPENSGPTPGSGGSRERAASCEERIERHLKQRLADFRQLLADYVGSDPLRSYGVAFYYVPPHAFPDQPEEYCRYQLSWGCPCDDIRFFVDADDLTCHRVEYWFLDSGDDAHRVLDDDDKVLLDEIWEWLTEIGAVEDQFVKVRAR